MTPTLPLFIYGTLLDPHRRQKVLGRPLGDTPLIVARLVGYRRHRVAGVDYPAVRRATGGEVEGALLTVRGRREWDRLIAYETAEYLLRRVQVMERETHRLRPALCFVARPRLPLTREAWDLESWRRRNDIFDRLR